MSEYGRIALLIDGDNARPGHLARIIKTVSELGEITIRKIFANWNLIPPARWNNHLLTFHAIPVHVPAYKRGKNATDISLVIDAMKIASAREADTICIVASDSDFTQLVLHLHEVKIKVIVIGKNTASLPLMRCCDLFIDEATLPDDKKLLVRVNMDTEIETGIPGKKEKKKIVQKQELKIVGTIDLSKFKAKKKKPDLKILSAAFINQAFDSAVNGEGFATEKKFRKAILLINPAFQPNQFGFNNYRELIASLSDRFHIVMDRNTGTIIRRK
jgi:uncharacterized LabA/DUF88 family protein